MAAFGGSQFATKNPKTRRPVHARLPMHVVLKARKGGLRTLKTFSAVNAAVVRINQKYGHRMYDYSNNGNHLHISLKLSCVDKWAAYIRELTSEIVRILRRAGLLATSEKYWLGRPFTRVLQNWGRAFAVLRNYIQLNEFEAFHRVTRQEAISMREVERRLRSIHFDVPFFCVIL